MLTPFYNGLLRKYHIAFGSLFKQVTLLRNESFVELDPNSKESQRVVVPIEYSPRESWLTRLRKDPDMAQQVNYTRPRMAYEMTGMRYDNARKLNSLNSQVRPAVTGDYRRFFVGTPYILSFSLYASTRSVEDANEITEQIIPYFAPEYTMTIKLLPSLGITDRMRILMDGTPQWMDSYEQDGFAKTRDILLTFNFSVLATFYGPMASTPATLIRKVIVDLYETPYDSSLTAPTYLQTNAFENLELESGDGRLLNEGTATDLLSTALRTDIVVQPNPLDAPATKPVGATTTTITRYEDGRVVNVFTEQSE